MTNKPLLPSEEIMETCAILTNLSPKNTPKIIRGNEIRKAFQNYKSENIEKYLSYINMEAAIKIIKEARSQNLKLSDIKTIEIDHKTMNDLIGRLSTEIHGKKPDT
jgi:hypothetical protein